MFSVKDKYILTVDRDLSYSNLSLKNPHTNELHLQLSPLFYSTNQTRVGAKSQIVILIPSINSRY